MCLCESGSSPAREPRVIATSWASCRHRAWRSRCGSWLRRCRGRVRPHRWRRAFGAVAAMGYDVVVVVRGGGSRADLVAFDAEPIARAIATAPVPVWTGIGHTGDQSVADIVAHQSFITPTECGQELVRRVADWWRSVVHAADAVTRLASGADRAGARCRQRRPYPARIGRISPVATPYRSRTSTCRHRRPPRDAARRRLRVARWTGRSERLVAGAQSAVDRQGDRTVVVATVARGL